MIQPTKTTNNYFIIQCVVSMKTIVYMFYDKYSHDYVLHIHIDQNTIS